MTDRIPYRAIEAARPYASIQRLPISLLLDNVRSMYNVGAFFRAADGAGIERLFLSGITARPPKKQISKTALGAEESVAWSVAADPVTLVRELRAHHHEIAAIETSVRSLDLFDWHPAFPVFLIFGHELDGVRPELLDLCDTHVRIPMLGIKHSLNVATAGGIVLYELLRKYRHLAENGRS